MKNMRLKTRFIILFAGMLVILLSVYIFWSNYTREHQTQRETREKAIVLSKQLDAVWEFIAINQNGINHNDSGYKFRNLYCFSASRNISKLLETKTGYIIRYVNHSPHDPDDTPDYFEIAALKRFEADKNLTEVYDIADYNGTPSFRYVMPIVADSNCISCHTEPSYEPDIKDYTKESWEIGNLAGALSIIMPAYLYEQNSGEALFREIIFFIIIMLIFITIVYYAVIKLVTMPLGKLIQVMERAAKGESLDTAELENIKAEAEIQILILYLNSIIKENNSQTGLNGKVGTRTQGLARVNEILRFKQQQLEITNRKLIEERKYQSAFFAIMCHELRTPLTSSAAFLDVFEKIAEKTEKERRIINEIKTNNQNLLSLINDILDMARFEAGRNELILEQTDMVDVVNVVENVIRPLADKKNIDFSTDVSPDVPIINADREKLKHIMENLVSNAVKFTQNGGKVCLYVKYDGEKNEINILVRDNGIGIAPEEHVLVFKKFMQVDSTMHRPYNGSGLGLVVVQELTKLHGGSVRLDSALGKGSLFTVVIPVKHKEDRNE